MLIYPLQRRQFLSTVDSNFHFDTAKKEINPEKTVSLDDNTPYSLARKSTYSKCFPSFCYSSVNSLGLITKLRSPAS